MWIFVRDTVELVVDQGCEVVQKCHYELSLIVVSIAELRLGLIAFLSRDESHRWELAQQSLSLFHFDTILQVVLIKQVISYLRDVWMASILGT